ncbi:LytR C-terminal domain-containing protein [Candidatus Microgenomates bacterium]|nr:LytR C-terminal domain-containing protein [Candidatus Microgenomates bacterium]
MEEEQKQELTTETDNNETSQEEVSPLRYNIPTSPRRGGSKKFFWFVLVLLLAGAIIGGFVLIGGQQKEEEIAPTPTPTEQPSPTPTPETSPTPTKKVTPSPTEKLSPTPTKKPTKGLSVKVLNGSGVTGAAKEASDYLSGLGYEIAGTGNASTTDFENTTIDIKSAKESLLPQLKIDLQTKYTIGTTSATLSASESADAVVTVGKK